MFRRPAAENLVSFGHLWSDADAGRGRKRREFDLIRKETVAALNARSLTVVHMVPHEEPEYPEYVVDGLSGDIRSALLDWAEKEGIKSEVWRRLDIEAVQRLAPHDALVIWVDTPSAVTGDEWRALWHALGSRHAGVLVVLNDRFVCQRKVFDRKDVLPQLKSRYVRLLEVPTRSGLNGMLEDKSRELSLDEPPVLSSWLDATCVEQHLLHVFAKHLELEPLEFDWWPASTAVMKVVKDLIYSVVEESGQTVDPVDVATAWAMHDALRCLGFTANFEGVRQLSPVGSALASHVDWWRAQLAQSDPPALPLWAVCLLSEIVTDETPEVHQRVLPVWEALIAAERAEAGSTGAIGDWHLALKSVRGWQYLGNTPREDFVEAFKNELQPTRARERKRSLVFHQWQCMDHLVEPPLMLCRTALGGPNWIGEVTEWAQEAPLNELAGIERAQQHAAAYWHSRKVYFEQQDNNQLNLPHLSMDRLSELRKIFEQPHYSAVPEANFDPARNRSFIIPGDTANWHDYLASLQLHRVVLDVVYAVGLNGTDQLPMVWPDNDNTPPLDKVISSAQNLSEQQAAILLECVTATDPLEDVWVRYCERVDRLREGHDGGLWQDYQNAAFDVVAARLFAPVGGQIQACQVFMFACEGFSDVWLRLHVQIRVLGFLSELLVSVRDADGAVEVTLRRVECARELVSLGHSRFIDIFGEVVADASQVFVDAGRGGEIEAVLRENVDLARGRQDRGDSV